MVHRSFVSILILALAFAVASCGRPRPEAPDAKAEFLRLYPTAEVIGVRMTEDEVVARSFDITYRRAGETQTKTLNLQYMENDKGVYELRPPPPSELP